jgi:type II secretory pathway pseudopilin PulG
VRPARSGESGYALVALLAAATIGAIVMATAIPSWRYVMKNEREEELLFRGDQIAKAIERFQRKRGNALPTSIDLLVKEKFLRKAYKDPMTPDGKWRMLRPGEPIPVSTTNRGSASPTPRPSPTPQPGGGIGGPQTVVGPFNGVVSHNTEKSLRLLNGQDSYDRWFFIAGQQRWVGKTPGPQRGPGPSPTPRQSPK